MIWVRNVAILCVVALMLVFPAGGVYAQDFEPEGGFIPFEPGDTLEEIREKIAYNGYDFEVSHNWVFDMSDAEKAQFLTRRPPAQPRPENDDIGPLAKYLGKRDLPTAFDWRNVNGHTYIGDVRNQGSCGSCYSFGANAAAECTYNYANGLYDSNCVDFSESYIIWCLGRLRQYSSHFFGCNGADYDYY
ncbi:MAG TPA: C1 family peptidase, partial [bacterium]|nr:C1 family peptidase [bacterium]